MTAHVNDSLGDRLREAGIAYLDAAGNACLVAEPLVYIWLRGFKPLNQPERVTRAFQTTGLQLIALLISRPNAVEQPYRELRPSWTFARFRLPYSQRSPQPWIHQAGSAKQNSLVNRASLLDQWLFGYATRLRPRLLPQTYRQADNRPVEELPTRIPKAMKDEVLIGGELAAALATRHLRPQTATFHVRPHRPVLPILKEMRLVPDRTGNVVLLEQFGEMVAWRWEKHASECLVSPLFVYAELLHGMPDDRRRETAKLIFDENLSPILNNELSTDRR